MKQLESYTVCKFFESMAWWIVGKKRIPASEGVGEHLHHWAVDYIESLGYQKLYLLAFDTKIVEWYKNLGWATFKSVELNEHLTIVTKCTGSNLEFRQKPAIPG